MKKFKKIVWAFLGVLYYPIYALAWALFIIARLLLAISYYGMLERRVATDIFKSIFSRHGRR